MRHGKKSGIEAAQETREVVDHVINTFEKQEKLVIDAIEVAKESNKIASFIMEKVLKDEYKTILSPESLKGFAEEFPAWSVGIETRDGGTIKSYSRKLDAVNTGHVNSDTVRRFTESEHFDRGLLDVLDAWNGTGDLVNPDSPDGYLMFTVYASEAGPITFEDVARVDDAEIYLQNQGLILPIEELQNTEA